MMKVIDLLNKIANKEIPKKIMYDDKQWIYDEKLEDYITYDDSRIDWKYTVMEYINDKVEILEEEKEIPEKLHLFEETQNIIRENNYKLVYHDIHKCIVSLECKYNQLIDYLKSKGE